MQAIWINANTTKIEPAGFASNCLASELLVVRDGTAPPSVDEMVKAGAPHVGKKM